MEYYYINALWSILIPIQRQFPALKPAISTAHENDVFLVVVVDVFYFVLEICRHFQEARAGPKHVSDP